MEEKLNKYFLNLLSKDEKKQLFDELDKDKELQKEFTDELNTLSLIMMQDKEGDLPYARHKLKEFKLKTRKIFLRSIAFKVAKYAAIVLLAISLYSLFQNYGNNNFIDDYAYFEVPNGQRARLLLPDNTIVWLNAGSKLKYPSGFSKKNRSIYLEGEAYFEVTSDKKHPFEVQTSLTTIKVLGTKFNVKSYSDEIMYVALMEGKVELDIKNNSNKLVLNPDEQVTISPETGGITLSKQNQANMVNSWTSGEFSYVNQPLYSIANDLERQYNVNITILDGGLAEELFTSRLTEKESIIQVLNRFKETRELDYKIEGEDIMIFKR